MPSLNFQARFAPMVESGQKRCTIRAKRKHPIKVGDTLFLYTGMRWKTCRKLREVVCSKVTPVVIDGVIVFLDGRELSGKEVATLARNNGFQLLQEFWAFFHGKNGYLEGDLIEWEVSA